MNYNIVKQISLIILISLFLELKSQVIQASWEKCYSGSQWDQGNSIISNDNGYLIYGSTESSDGDVNGHHGLSDGWLIQVDTVGNMLWSKCFGGSKGEYGEEILYAGNNNYYLIGPGGSEDGDISYDPYPNSTDYWIIKIDDSGNIIWDKVLGGNSVDETRNAIVTNDGGVLCLGISASHDGNITDPHGDWDLWMIKLNVNGEIQWDLSLGGTGFEEGASVNQTSDGGYIVVGATDGKGGGNYNSSCNHHSYGYMDTWVVKLDSLRNIEWQQCYGGSLHEGAKSVKELSDGYIVLSTCSSNDGDISGYHGTLGSGNSSDDIWVIKIDFQGSLIWQKCLGGSSWDFARNIFTTSDGGYMIIGKTGSNDGDVEGYHGIDIGIYEDVWMAKLTADGELTWQYCYGGGGREYMYRGVVQKSDYNYVMTIGTDTDEWQCNGIMWPSLRVFELSDSTTGINHLDSSNKISIYPNPATSTLIIDFENHNAAQKPGIEIYNSLGYRVYKVEGIGNLSVVDVSSWNKGIYIVKVLTRNDIFSRKVVVR